jgi:hypothetical protein
LWATNSYQELPGITDGYIIPSKYYDKYPLVFTRYHLDRIIVRIGSNEKQKQAIARKTTDSGGSSKASNDSWYKAGVSREGNCIQQPIDTHQVAQSDHIFN